MIRRCLEVTVFDLFDLVISLSQWYANVIHIPVSSNFTFTCLPAQFCNMPRYAPNKRLSCIFEKKISRVQFMHGDLSGWGYSDCMYFAIITLMTVGYGDLVPKNWFSRGSVWTFFFWRKDLAGRSSNLQLLGGCKWLLVNCSLTWLSLLLGTVFMFIFCRLWCCKSVFFWMKW